MEVTRVKHPYFHHVQLKIVSTVTTQLSLALQHILCFHSQYNYAPYTELYRRRLTSKSVDTINTFTVAKIKTSKF